MENVHNSVQPVVSRIETLVTEIQADSSDSRLSSLVDDVLQASEGLPTHLNSEWASKLNASAIHLWNRAVALKTKAGSATFLNARLRHVACSLALAAAAGDASRAVLKKHLTMTMKTGRAWLDAGNPAMADNALDLADQCLKRLEELNAKSVPRSSHEADVDGTLFRVTCFRIEAAVALANHEKALEYHSKCKDMLSKRPNESVCLCLVCYNLGVDTFQRNLFEQSVFWLGESHELGKLKSPVTGTKGEKKRQAKTLRLLSNAYMEWNPKEHWQKALNAAGLANAEHSHPAGYHMKAKILMQCNIHDSRIQTAFEDTIRHPDLDISLGISTIQVAIENQRLDLAFSGLRQLGTRFRQQSELNSIRIFHLELLLKHDKTQEAGCLIEEAIMEQTRGDALDVGHRKSIHRLLWQRAEKDFDSERYGEALIWFNYSLGLLIGDERYSSNAGRLQRNRCSCFLMERDVERAKEAILEAEKCDKNHLFTQYFKFKISLLENDSTTASDCLLSMGRTLESSAEADVDQNEALGMISLAAQMAFEKNNREVAEKALEHLVQYTPSVRQALTSLRCLVRLKLTDASEVKNRSVLGAVLYYINTALQKLVGTCVDGKLPEELHSEVCWFMKMAWNVGQECGDASEELHDFFVACYKLSDLCLEDPQKLLLQKTSLLIATASALHLARKGEDDAAQKLSDALMYIDKCRQIPSSDDQRRRPSSSVEILLGLYEFEAKCRLKFSPDELSELVSQIRMLPGFEPKTLETVAALAIDESDCYRGIAINALEEAVAMYGEDCTADVEKLSKAIHSLTQLLLPSDDEEERARAMKHCQLMLELLENDAFGSSYPEMEKVWLLTKSWNCGIVLHSRGMHKEAEQWCSLSMGFLQRLTTNKANYETHMTTVYGEILAKLEGNNSKQKQVSEE